MAVGKNITWNKWEAISDIPFKIKAVGKNINWGREKGD